MSENIGTKISREEAIRLADEILETAETDRLKYAEMEAEREKYFSDENLTN